jgi:4'-phosphopantetheinyl transferase
MRIEFFHNPASVTPEELEAELALLPQWRRSKALGLKNFTNRVLCVKAFLLLARILREDYALGEVPQFVYGGHGKPSLEAHGDIHFNISHCRRGAMCVVDTHEVGCDMECSDRAVRANVLARCMNDAERRAVESAADPRLEFARLWTRKEAVCKCTGKGLDDGLPSVLLPERMAGFGITTCVAGDCGIVYSVCRKLH